MIVLTTPEAARDWSRAHRDAGRAVGLVPTQGGLHDGHGALIENAREQNGAVALSLFVNPFQFRWDKYLAYPRPLDADLAFANARGVDAVYLPGVTDVYPELPADGFQQRVIHERAHNISDHADRSGHDFMRIPVLDRAGQLQLLIVPECLAMRMDGTQHAWHFDAVATVVERLYRALPSDRVYYGNKDVQQTAVLGALGEWLRESFPDAVPAMHRVGVHRDAHGVSMSSRHALLDGQGASAARVIAAAMRTSAADIEQGQVSIEAAVERLRGVVHSRSDRLDYLDVVDRDTLLPARRLTAPGVMYAAFWIGDLRLAEVAELTPTGSAGDGGTTGRSVDG